ATAKFPLSSSARFACAIAARTSPAQWLVWASTYWVCIESQSLKGGFACLTHERSEVLDRPVIPLHDQRPGKPKMGIREVGIERKRLFEQAIGCRPIGAGGLVHMPEPALTIIPRPPCAPPASPL